MSSCNTLAANNSGEEQHQLLILPRLQHINVIVCVTYLNRTLISETRHRKLTVYV